MTTQYYISSSVPRISSYDKVHGYFEHLKRPIRILSCHFATPAAAPKKDQPNHKYDLEYFQDMFYGNCTVAVATEANFVSHIRSCDVLYLHGGDTPTLINALKGLKGKWLEVLEDITADKVVFAVSAGVGALAKYSYNVDYKKVLEGLGVLPIKTIVHFQTDGMEVDWGFAMHTLYTHGEKLQCLALSDDSIGYIYTKNAKPKENSGSRTI